MIGSLLGCFVGNAPAHSKRTRESYQSTAVPAFVYVTMCKASGRGLGLRLRYISGIGGVGGGKGAWGWRLGVGGVGWGFRCGAERGACVVCVCLIFGF